MENPLVSVIMPTFNGAKYIRRAIESVQGQTYKNIEIVIVDDGSVDKTLDIISDLCKKDTRIIILLNEINIGFVKSLNRGAKRAEGKYIARIDDDDFWCDPKRLEKQVFFLQAHPEYVLVGGGMIKIDENKREVSRYLFPEKDKDIRKTILLGDSISHGTVVFRKDSFEKVGGFDEEFGFFADLALSLKLGRVGKIYNFQEYFFYYFDKELGTNYAMRNYDIRRKIWNFIALKKRHKNDYPGYKKAYLYCWASYFYSFLPFRQKLRPFLVKIRALIFGRPAYKYIKKRA